MDANIAAIIIGVIASLPGVVALYIQWRKDKHKEPQEDVNEGLTASRDAASTVITYSGELRNVRIELSEVRAEVFKLTAERQADKMLIAEWQYGIERLIAQLVSMDITPVWRPRPKDAGKAAG
jgi:hypothetical protein